VVTPDDSRLRGRYEARFALIRPDQHVAWRGNAIPADGDALLAQVTGSAPGTPADPHRDGKQWTVSDDTEAIIRQLEHQRIQALLSKDWETLSSLLTDDLVHIHANGTVEDKATYMTTMSSQFEMLRVDRPALDVRVLGDSAIVTGPLNQGIRIMQSGAIVELQAVATQVWVKRPEGWAQCGFQATRVG
jgi:ketosteroid isomerase-like protein